ncbi:hypothetical protein J4429_03965, partial [Candidatus Pacearchaeota archaeon]|nr:hypothetical protein [Candidatus Pacearchaeota archaeon]
GATPVKCKENWKCLDWSLCKKLNESSEELNNENKNYIQNRCDLFGFDESSCGFRIRFCEDLNRCNILLAKPETIEACDYVYQQNCNDNIKNQNEEGIDCGGDCKPCESPKPVQESKSYWKVGILLSLILLIGVIFFFYRKKNR